ncbi:hypothetical protein [Sphingobium herbicidovorans]|uniref:hypothetical protein n=1 Tax=Sphingobium herbicidovorans TaxID=76947 RepID=UPI0012E06A39|nr:hypothetical protein [Sphingobium herbicidovorans]
MEKLSPKLAQARFASQQAGNPFAPVDAEIADDLDRLIQTVSASKGKKKLKEARISSLVSDLEESYLPIDEIRALGLPPSVTQRLRAAMAQRHLLSDQEVAALADGTPAGDAVSAAISKARRLRALVPEGSGSGGTAKRVIGEAVGGAAGFKLGGPVGAWAGSALGRMATAGAASETATAARELAAQAPKFAQLPEVAAGRTQAKVARDALRKLSADAQDAPFYAKREADAAKAQEAASAARMAQEGKRISVANAKDDIVGNGGFRAFAYERTGLLPSQQDAGALRLLKDGTITPEQFNAFLAEPDKLMVGNAGNAIVDRLAAMAEKGALARDPKWQPQPKIPMQQGQPPAIYSAGEVAPQPIANEGGGMAIDIAAPAAPTWKSSDQGITEAQRNFAKAYEAWSDELDKAAPDRDAVNSLYDAKEQAGRILDAEVFQQSQQQSGPAIRNPIAYRATAEANQARVSSVIDAVRSDSSLDDGAREILSSAIATIGNTSSRDKAQGIATDALDRLPEGLRDKARATLQPLVSQIKK